MSERVLVPVPLRILHVLHYASVGGVESYTVDLFRALEAAGHRNALFFEGHANPALAENRRAVRAVSDLSTADHRHADALADDVLSFAQEEGASVAFFHTLTHPRFLARVLGALPTLYFAHGYDLFCPSGDRLFQRSDAICSLQGVPDARCLVNAYVRGCATRRPLALWDRYVRSRQFGALMRRAEGVVCDSDYVRARHVENGFLPSRLHVLPSAIPIPPPPLETTPREPIILFVGRVTPQKGLEYLLRAVPYLRLPSQVVIVGDGFELPSMRALVRELRIDGRVTFLGPLSRADVDSLYQRVAVLAVPSVWPEPWGMVGPEAMARGLPVVAFRVGGIPEWLLDGDNGFLVESRDVLGLADRIDRIVGDPILAKRLGHRGRMLVAERYSFAGHAERMAAILADGIRIRGSSTGAS